MVWDMSFTEKAKEQVAELNTEGDKYMAHDVPRAEALFRKALTLRRHDPMSWYNLGVCRFKANDLEGAVQCYQHALQFDPKFLQAFNNLGTTLAYLNRLAEAEEVFDRGLAVNPNHPKFYFGKANLAVMNRNVSRARNLLKMALEKDPTYKRAKEVLGELDVLEKIFGEQQR
jgi:tetratricopeptide (TPR) repeat protein